jgi:hypothetical protein
MYHHSGYINEHNSAEQNAAKGVAVLAIGSQGASLDDAQVFRHTGTDILETK